MRRASSSRALWHRLLSAGAIASVRHLRNSSLERQAQQERAATLKRRLREAGLPVMDSPCHIVPVLVGDPVRCKQASDVLLDELRHLHPADKLPDRAEGNRAASFHAVSAPHRRADGSASSMRWSRSGAGSRSARPPDQSRAADLDQVAVGIPEVERIRWGPWRRYAVPGPRSRESRARPSAPEPRPAARPRAGIDRRSPGWAGRPWARTRGPHSEG